VGLGVPVAAGGGMSSTSGGWASCKGRAAKSAGGLRGVTVPPVAGVVVWGGVGGGFPCIVAKRVRRARTSCPKLETLDFREPKWRPTRSTMASLTTVPISATAAAVEAWAAVVAARACIVVETLALFLAVAASRVETLSCVLPMSTTSKARVEEGGRDRSMEVGARVLEVGARFAEGVNRADTIVELVMKVCQSRVGSASVLHERLSPNVGVEGLLQVREVGDSRHE